MSGSIPGPNGTTVWPIEYGEEDDMSENDLDLDGLMRQADMARKDERMQSVKCWHAQKMRPDGGTTTLTPTAASFALLLSCWLR